MASVMSQTSFPCQTKRLKLSQNYGNACLWLLFAAPQVNCIDFVLYISLKLLVSKDESSS